MSKICVGIPSLGINPTYFLRKLDEHKESGIDFLIFVNYRKGEIVKPIPDQYVVSGFRVVQYTDDYSIGNFRARLLMMKEFLKTDYEYLLTFDIDDKFTNLNESNLLLELGYRDYTKFRFSNVNIDPVDISTEHLDDLINKKFTVGIHNCLMTRSLVEKLVNHLDRYSYEYFNFGEDILFTSMILNLVNEYKVSSMITADYDDSGASFTYGKSFSVAKSIVRLFDHIIPDFNRAMSDKFLEYLFLSNFSYILYEYYQRFKMKERNGLHTS